MNTVGWPIFGMVRTFGDVFSIISDLVDALKGDWLGESVALKVLRNIGDMDERSERHFLREINIWRNLQVRLHRHMYSR